jgi:hypothetical protein
LAAAGLAAVIALGFVFAANQGNEVTAGDVVISQTSDAAWNSRIEFLTRQYQMRQASQPTVNIELHKLQTAGLVGGADAISPSVSPEAYKALQQRGTAGINVPQILSAVPAPVFSPEAARLQQANVNRLQEMWSQRYQDLVDRFENQMVPAGQAVYQAPWPQGFQDLMDLYEARIAEGKAIDASPDRLPREKRS